MQMDSHLSDYAEGLLVKPCMEKRGFDWPVPWQDVTRAQTSPTMSAQGRRIFNTTTAEKWGYRNAPILAPDAAAWRSWVETNVSISPEKDRVFTLCLESARKSLPPLPGEAQAAMDYIGQAYKAGKRSVRVQRAIDAWKKCMAAEGISDLPDDPHEMPTRELSTRLGMIGTTEPTADELRVAVEDARCRDSSRFSPELYAAEWDGELKLLRENADRLHRIKAMLDANRKRVMAVITTHAPAH